MINVLDGCRHCNFSKHGAVIISSFTQKEIKKQSCCRWATHRKPRQVHGIVCSHFEVSQNLADYIIVGKRKNQDLNQLSTSNILQGISR